MSRIDVPVLIVGGGPAGIMAGMLLGRLGIESRIVEQRDGPARAPQAHVVNPRTLEICRTAGVDMAALRAASVPPEEGGFVRWVETLTGAELGALPYERQDPAVLALTPTPLANLSQHRFEPILLEQLRKQGSCTLHYREQWESATQDERGVTSTIRDRASGASHEVRSRWLLGCDGAGSRVRKSLGIEMQGPQRLASFVMIHFSADLRPLVAERPGILYWVMDPDARGAFVAHDLRSTWVFMQSYEPETESPDDFPEARCREIVRRAMGPRRVDFRIETISPWTMTAQVADRYADGRIFLVGDAAHRFPPTGGLGLNTGAQDAHNLAWKLAMLEAGRVPASLLDSYESERRPVAQENCEQSVRNALKMIEVVQAYDGDRKHLATAIANQQDHFDMLALQLGFAYETGALVPDGTPKRVGKNVVRDFVPTTRPGSRVPHAWVERGGRPCSTLDLLPYDRFTLLTGESGEAWEQATARIDSVPITCLRIGRDVTDPDGHWARVREIQPDGALLVRPDQHIAWRTPSAVPDARQALEDALRAILKPWKPTGPTRS